MIALVCVGLYIVIGWRVAVRAYFRIEAHDRQWQRDLCAKYPSLYPSQASIDQAEEEWVEHMADLRRLGVTLAGMVWPVVIIGLAVKHFVDASIAKGREKVAR